MKCSKAERWILLRDSGELSPRRQRALGRHLARCPTCQASAQSLVELTHAARSWDAGQPGPGAVGAIRTGLIEAGDRREAWTWQPARPAPARLAWSLASLAIVVAAGLLWFSANRPGAAPAVAREESPAAQAEPGGLAWEDGLDAELDALTELLASSLNDQNGKAAAGAATTDEDAMARELLELEGYTI